MESTPHAKFFFVQPFLVEFLVVQLVVFRPFYSVLIERIADQLIVQQFVKYPVLLVKFLVFQYKLVVLRSLLIVLLKLVADW